MELSLQDSSFEEKSTTKSVREVARDRRIKANYVYTTIKIIHGIVETYPNIPLEAWALLSWFYNSYINPKMIKDSENFMRVESDLVISRLYNCQIRDRNAVTKHFKWLCGDSKDPEDTQMYFLERKTIYVPGKDGDGPVRVSLYRPTDMAIEYFQYDKEAADSVRELGDRPSEYDKAEKPEWIPSRELVIFKDAVISTQKDIFPQSEFFKKDGTPTKYWEDADKYIHALMEGTFTKDFCKEFKDTPTIPKLSLQEIMDTALKVILPQKPNAGSIFMHFQKKTSPFVSRYLSDHPPIFTVSPEKLEALKVKHPKVYENSSVGILDYVDKIKGLGMDDPAAYVLYDKFVDRFDEDAIADCNQYNKGERKFQKNHVQTMLKWYIEMAIMRHKWGPKFVKTWEEWASSLKIGKFESGSAWGNYVRYVYEVKHIWITDNTTEQKKILEYIAEQKKRKEFYGE